MAQTRKRRRRKHRGTQTGRIDNRGPRGRPRTREEARARAARKRRTSGPVRNPAPTWGSAVKRGLIGAAILFLVWYFIGGRTFGESLVFAAAMLALYIPGAYYLDRFLYRRRLRKEQALRAAQHQR